VQASDQQHAVDLEQFRDGLAKSLAEGAFRLVIVLDSAPDELVQVVGYLRSITDKIEVDLVTVTAYDVAGSQVLVPQRIEPGRRARELSDARVKVRQSGTLHRGSTEFRSVITNLEPARRQILERLTDWAETLEADWLVKLATYRGKSGMTTLLPRLISDDAGLVSIYCVNGSALLQFWRSVFDRRAPLSVPAVEAAASTQMRQGNTTRDFPESLLRALTQAYREAVGTPST
jgi:hypothetical protein